MVFPVAALMTMPCVVDHSDPGPADDYGDHPVETVTSSDETCWLAQSTRGEEEGVETERWRFYFPPTVVVDANDVVHVGGASYQMWGAPWVVVDPLTTQPTHIEATAVRRV